GLAEPACLPPARVAQSSQESPEAGQAPPAAVLRKRPHGRMAPAHSGETRYRQIAHAVRRSIGAHVLLLLPPTIPPSFVPGRPLEADAHGHKLAPLRARRRARQSPLEDRRPPTVPRPRHAAVRARRAALPPPAFRAPPRGSECLSRTCLAPAA